MGDPRCQVAIVMGKTDPRPRATQQSMVHWCRWTRPASPCCAPLPVFGYDDVPRPHGDRASKRARAAANVLLGEGRGFEIAQVALAPGRIHHCMRPSAPQSGPSS